MATGLMSASVLVIFVVGALIGYGFSERKRAARARRQTAAQTFLYRQLRDLQAARQADCSTQAPQERVGREKVGSYS